MVDTVRLIQGNNLKVKTENTVDNTSLFSGQSIIMVPAATAFGSSKLFIVLSG